jgi:hypothetical protein
MSSYSPEVSYVNVYAVGRIYGGPEEGGWWYDTGTVLKSVRCLTRGEADRVADVLRADYPDTGRSSSVLGGDDYRVWVEDNPGANYPTERPRYE